MWRDRRCVRLLLLLCIAGGAAAAQQTKESSKASVPAAKTAKQPPAPFIGRDDGLAVISAALDARTRRSAKADCSHLVHDIYERAGFSYDYASSSDLYEGTDPFRRVKHPQPGDLVVWPGHVGIVVNPAQRTFYSALSSGLGVDAYDSEYWKKRGQPRFFRYLRTETAAANRVIHSRYVK